jgi:hemoglobin
MKRPSASSAVWVGTFFSLFVVCLLQHVHPVDGFGIVAAASGGKSSISTYSVGWHQAGWAPPALLVNKMQCPRINNRLTSFSLSLSLSLSPAAVLTTMTHDATTSARTGSRPLSTTALLSAATTTTPTTSSSTPLFDRIGGRPAVEATVDAMYERILNDPTLSPFFRNTDMASQKNHQAVFLTLAFGGGMMPGNTKIDDIAAYITEKHGPSISRGLNELHFDSVAGHIVDSLKSLAVPGDLIEEVLGVVAPLRPLFETKTT